ncbi:MAG: Ig-like domain-containing protein [Deltaproteobacteria bacterium]|nr:Ig-like domain-containing protein [Deltaproteobacteria bacterium]
MKRSLVVAATLLGLVACEKKPVSIQVTPPTAKMDKAGMTQTLAATGLDAENNKLPLAAATWSSSDAKVATVDNTGKVTAVGSGVATIKVTQEEVNGAAAVTVEIAQAVKVEPSEIKIAKADDKPTVKATVVNEKGAPIAGKPVTFAIADPTIATVDATGVITGVKDGSTTLTAAAGTLKAEVKVDVAGMAPAPEKTAKADKKGKKKK